MPAHMPIAGSIVLPALYGGLPPRKSYFVLARESATMVLLVVLGEKHYSSSDRRFCLPATLESWRQVADVIGAVCCVITAGNSPA